MLRRKLIHRFSQLSLLKLSGLTGMFVGINYVRKSHADELSDKKINQAHHVIP